MDSSRRSYLRLGIILVVALVLRLGYFAIARHTPGYVWEDPDGYMTQALKLGNNGDAWRWSFDAVTYDIEGRRHALPPGYSVFLSAFALFPGFPFTAQIAQILLALVTIALVFALGRLLHSTRTGLIAAATYAVWLPPLLNVWSTSQETVYLPLILSAFVLLGRAMRDHGGAARFGTAGLVFGLAALTRSMPLFFAMPAALALVALAPDRRRAAAQAAGFLAGFLLLIVPYSIGLSRHFGQLAIIDTHGSIHFEVAPGEQAPGILETAAALWRSAAARPAGFVAECLERARSLLYVNGGRILQIYVVARTKAEAVIWKTLMHVGADGLLVASVLLAPLGAVLCRDRRLAVLLLIWAAVNIGIASLGGFGGARLRAPFEPVLIVFAAAVVAGQWQRPHVAWLGAALALSIAGAAAVLPQIPRSLRSWPDYGVAWPSIFSRQAGQLSGAAGFNVLPSAGVAQFDATPASAPSGSPAGATIHVSVRGVRVQSVYLPAGQTGRLRASWRQSGLAYLEVEARADDGSPAAVAIAPAR